MKIQNILEYSIERELFTELLDISSSCWHFCHHRYFLGQRLSVNTWYYNLDKEKTRDWNELSSLFLKEYAFNAEIDVGIRDLECIAQKADESFVDYSIRWRSKLSQMKNRPDSEEQIKLFIKGTLPQFRSKMYCMPLETFAQVYKVGLSIEDQINEEKKNAQKLKQVGYQGNGNRPAGSGSKPAGSAMGVAT